MFKKTKKILLMGGVLAAVSVGGSALAAGAAPVPPAHKTVAAKATTQKADQETADEGGSASETGSEVPGNDGPGGHADEPGNPNAQNEE